LPYLLLYQLPNPGLFVGEDANGFTLIGKEANKVGRVGRKSLRRFLIGGRLDTYLVLVCIGSKSSVFGKDATHHIARDLLIVFDLGFVMAKERFIYLSCARLSLAAHSPRSALRARPSTGRNSFSTHCTLAHR
jgi:hypothetical protein